MEGNLMKGMIDNRKVGDRKGGIKAKIQREHDVSKTQKGEMHMNAKDGGTWVRSGDSLTPRKA
jgi:hypothetical protein